MSSESEVVRALLTRILQEEAVADSTPEQAADRIMGALAKRGAGRLRELIAERAPALSGGDAVPVAWDGWHDGEPPHPWRTEWFIAETIYDDRVVLIALPKENSYDYKTADETHMMAQNIKRWMQFPDSEFVPPSPSAAP